MRKLLCLVLLGSAVACEDGNPMQPQGEPVVEKGPIPAAASQDPGENAKWSIHALANNAVLQGLDDFWTTPSGIAHYSGYVNRFDMWGDLNGYAWFIGDVHSNTRLLKGRTIARPFLLEVHSSVMGKAGTFECVGTFKLLGVPGPEYVQYGNLTACQGTGDFEGMMMKGYTSNELNPGTDLYDLWGEIW